MPYFSWTGVNLTTRMVKGVSYAQSVQKLDEDLLIRDIALLRAYPLRWAPRFLYPIKRAVVTQFFKQLLVLLEAGVHMHKALSTLTIQAGPYRFSESIEQLAQAVERGSSLSEALAVQSSLFDPLAVHICALGQASSLPQALRILVEYQEQQALYKCKVRQALTMPLITLCFFIAITVLIVTLVIPQFASMFERMNATLPTLTRSMIALSTVLLSYSAAFVGVISLCLVVVIGYYSKRMPYKRYRDMLILKIPYVSWFIQERTAMFFFSALGALLRADVPLMQALSLARAMVSNNHLQRAYKRVQEHVEQGYSLSNALIQENLIRPDLQALIVVGEESGALGDLVTRAGTLCSERFLGRLAVFTTALQPLLLLCMACAITLLMLAVYLPILSLSSVVGI